MEEELTEEVEMAKRRIDEINMELNQVGGGGHRSVILPDGVVGVAFFYPYIKVDSIYFQR